MKKTTVLLSMMLLAGFFCMPNSLRAARKLAGMMEVNPSAASPAPAPAAPQAKKPQWKSRAEYDAFQAFVKEKDPQKKISLIQAFVQKYPKSDFLANAYLVEMQTYAQLNKTDQAIAAAKKVLSADPNNLAALFYLSYSFPYTFKSSDANASTELSEAKQHAQDGLQMLQSQQKREGETQQQFEDRVKQERGAFNVALGFIAVQQKDYNQAIKSLEAAAQDEPNNVLVYSLLGQSYYNGTPRDINKSIWYLARATALAQKSNNPNADRLKKFYDQVYEAQHGSNAGAKGVLAQAASTPTIPADFKVAPPPHHASTGNVNLDAFYKIEDAITVGGDTAQQNWAQLKGQPLGLVGHVDSVVPGSVPKTYDVRVDVAPESKGQPGTYDIVLQDSQPGVNLLKPGDPLRFQGDIASYSLKPNFTLTLDNVKIDQSVLKMAKEREEAAAQKKKAAAKKGKK